jgi:hypothetical protein
MHRFTAISASILLLATGVAAAQTTTPTQPGPAAPNSAAKTPCAPSGGNGGTVGSGENLSDKLASSNGVICPPNNVDQDMQKPAPGGGRMKVIPPPGGSGGDQSTIPK